VDQLCKNVMSDDNTRTNKAQAHAMDNAQKETHMELGKLLENPDRANTTVVVVANFGHDTTIT